MTDYKDLEISTLVDMLAENTSKYIKMHSEGATQEEFENCKKTIEQLQKEIESRKPKEAETGLD